MIDNNETVGVLGAGITGLCIAHSLKKQGIGVSIYERNKQPGGVIHTYRDGGWQIEEGPNTMLVKSQQIWDLLDELNLIGHIVTPGNQDSKRYIVRGGKLCAAPTSFMDFLRSDLLSGRAKFRLLKEPFISASQKEEESIAQFICRRLGKEPLDYAVNPFVSGVYAGDPERLSIRHTFSLLSELEQTYGSITKGLLKRSRKKEGADKALISFDEGLQLLPEAIAGRLGDSIHLNTEVQQISSDADGWHLKLQRGDKQFERRHHKLISALPLPQLTAVWDDEPSKQTFRELSDLQYAPVSILALGFRREQVGHSLNGFGMLIPEKEPFSLLGCLFSSSLFPERAPKDHVLLTCFIGGSHHPQLAAQSTETLVAEILLQLHHLLDVDGEPVFHHHSCQLQGIPQYNVGYDYFLQLMKQIEADNHSFFLTGNYRGGVSVPDCMINGFETAASAAALLDK